MLVRGGWLFSLSLSLCYNACSSININKIPGWSISHYPSITGNSFYYISIMIHCKSFIRYGQGVSSCLRRNLMTRKGRRKHWREISHRDPLYLQINTVSLNTHNALYNSFNPYVGFFFLFICQMLLILFIISLKKLHYILQHKMYLLIVIGSLSWPVSGWNFLPDPVLNLGTTWWGEEK